MMYAVIALGVLAAGWGIYAIEKKRAGGPIIYPIWRCDMRLLWLAFAAMTLILVSSVNLPRYLGLALHPVPVDAIIEKADSKEHCLVFYRYLAGASPRTDSDTLCGARAGEKRPAFYDAAAPEYSTLHPPSASLQNALLAIALLTLAVPSLLVAWLRATWVVGRRKAADKPEVANKQER